MNCMQVTGPSGSGKTSLLRAMAGLWSTGRGKITFYVEDEDESEPQTPLDMNGEPEKHTNRNPRGFFFLPQRPYMVLGSLRQQLLYPTWNVEVLPTSDGTKPAGMCILQS